MSFVSTRRRILDGPILFRSPGLARSAPNLASGPEPTRQTHLSAANKPAHPAHPYEFDVSVIVVSFNTRSMLRDCLHSIQSECRTLSAGLGAEILVVDNASNDGSADIVENEFGSSDIPVRLIRSQVNLGFAGANNLAMESACGHYLLLLNSDAFFHPGALRFAIRHMDENPNVGVGGARLVGPRGEWQPSARAFPGLWNTFVVLSGLASRYPKSRIFGSVDRTWASPDLEAEVDWVPGAFSIMRREALSKAGVFDPRFFLYCEEVDLCRRIKAEGFRVLYWPDVVVTHIGGESGRQLTGHHFSESQVRVELWQMRSTLIYFRKHHGFRVWGVRWLEDTLQVLRWLRNRWSSNPDRRPRADEARLFLKLMRQAWRETNGGRISPTRPW
jgi:GT2 family glycosyltransferase